MSYSLFGREEGLHREAWDFKGCIIGGLGVVVFKASWCSPWLRNWICRINKRKSNRIALQNKPMKRYVIYTEIEKKVWCHFSCIDLYTVKNYGNQLWSDFISVLKSKIRGKALQASSSLVRSMIDFCHHYVSRILLISKTYEASKKRTRTPSLRGAQ